MKRFNLGRRQVLGLGLVATALLPVRRARARAAGAPFKWAIDYGAASSPDVARAFDLLVLEPDHQRDILPLRGPGARLLGYVSLGEVERNRPYVSALDRAGALLAPNPNWPDARLADLRNPAWTALLLDTIIPGILARGFDGIFMDTLDNAEALEREDPIRNAGMIAAAATLVQAIRRRFPHIMIMQNRGYALLPGVAPHIDALLGEAMASRWNFAERRYELMSDDDWDWQAGKMRAAQHANPGLLLTTLDYWDPADRKTVARLYARERAADFHPYVATLALDRLHPEPKL